MVVRSSLTHIAWKHAGWLYRANQMSPGHELTGVQRNRGRKPWELPAWESIQVLLLVGLILEVLRYYAYNAFRGHIVPGADTLQSSTRTRPKASQGRRPANSRETSRCDILIVTCITNIAQIHLQLSKKNPNYQPSNLKCLTGLKLENYFFFTFTFSRPEVRKLLLFYVFTFSRPEVGKLFRIYVFTYSRPEVGKLFDISKA